MRCRSAHIRGFGSNSIARWRNETLDERSGPAGVCATPLYRLSEALLEICGIGSMICVSCLRDLHKRLGANLAPADDGKFCHWTDPALCCEAIAANLAAAPAASNAAWTACHLLYSIFCKLADCKSLANIAIRQTLPYAVQLLL